MSDRSSARTSIVTGNCGGGTVDVGSMFGSLEKNMDPTSTVPPPQLPVTIVVQPCDVKL